MLSNRRLSVIALLFLLVISVLVLYLTLPRAPEVRQLTAKPLLSGQFIKNPDIIHGSYGWLSATPENLAAADKEPSLNYYLNVSTDWKGDGWVGNNKNPLGGRYGVAIIHPVNVTVGRYIEQSTSLPAEKNYYLVFGLSNTIKFSGNISLISCNDNVFNIIIKDENIGESYLIFETVINTNDGWKDYMVDISRFRGHDITVRIDSLAGGPCGDWDGEFGGVDYIDILTEPPE